VSYGYDEEVPSKEIVNQISNNHCGFNGRQFLAFHIDAPSVSCQGVE